jgi:hypothetical protein
MLCGRARRMSSPEGSIAIVSFPPTPWTGLHTAVQRKARKKYGQRSQQSGAAGRGQMTMRAR